MGLITCDVAEFVSSSTAATSTVASSTSSVTLLAANPNRVGAVIHNDSNSRLYVKFGATASVSDFTFRLSAQDVLEVPFSYQGIIDGIWAPNVSGNARVTELEP